MGTFGIGIISGRIDHATRVGIILNAERIEKRRAFTFLTALNMALGNSKFDEDWFKALSPTDEDATAAYNLHEAHQNIANSMKGGI